MTCIAACVAVARSSKAVMVVVLFKCRRGSVDCNDAAVLDSLGECRECTCSCILLFPLLVNTNTAADDRVWARQVHQDVLVDLVSHLNSNSICSGTFN